MDNLIKVSVIIPVYNAQEYLPQCMDTLINQTLREIEIICVDDSSTDNSYDILLDYAKKDERIKVIQQPNGGAGAARNNGMQYATGEYLSILDADDFYESDMLEKAYYKAKCNGLDIVVFACDHYDNENKTYSANNYSIRKKLLPEHFPFAGTDVPKDVFMLFVGWSWDKLFKTSFVRENNLKFQEQRTTNDMLFVYSAVAKAEKIDIVEDVLVHHRMAAGTLSVTREKSWHCFYDALIALRNQLVEWNLYERFQQDYINYCVNFSLWNLRTLKEPTYTLLYNKLRDEWFDNLGVTAFPQSYFYNSNEYSQFRRIYDYPLGATIPEDTEIKTEIKKVTDSKKIIDNKKDKTVISKAMDMLKTKGVLFTIKKIISKLSGKETSL